MKQYICVDLSNNNSTWSKWFTLNDIYDGGDGGIMDNTGYIWHSPWALRELRTVMMEIES